MWPNCSPFVLYFSFGASCGPKLNRSIARSEILVDDRGYGKQNKHHSKQILIHLENPSIKLSSVFVDQRPPDIQINIFLQKLNE